MTAPTHVHVVVPARDEADHLDALLRSVALAAARVGPRVSVATTVVLDSCTDLSAAVAAGHPGVDLLGGRFGSVGAARAAGIARTPRDRDPASVWVACTDADGTVSPDWLAVHLDAADRGADLVLGTVRPDLHLSEPRLLGAWLAGHRLVEGHPHVHGANLGIRLSAYALVGGFAPLTTGEDHDLVARVREAGLPWVATDRAPVLTSGRVHARAPEGFATYLADLRAGLPAIGA